MEEKKQIYRVKTKCRNCGDTTIQEIEKGTTTNCLEYRDCEKCGCYHTLVVINY